MKRDQETEKNLDRLDCIFLFQDPEVRECQVRNTGCEILA